MIKKIRRISAYRLISPLIPLIPLIHLISLILLILNQYAFAKITLLLEGLPEYTSTPSS